MKFSVARHVTDAMLSVVAKQHFYDFGVGLRLTAGGEVERRQIVVVDAVDWSA